MDCVNFDRPMFMKNFTGQLKTMHHQNKVWDSINVNMETITDTKCHMPVLLENQQIYLFSAAFLAEH